jgi:histidyl-tRNA synthetase
MYRFKDHGDRDVALRFDLTVPLARFAAQYVGPNPNQIPTPFKRYHFGTVWRGENTQAGRYREFMQCDFDTIGTSSNAADCETALVIHDLMVALGFDRFEVRVNNRLVLNGVLLEFGLEERASRVLIALDKLGKQGPDAVLAEMTAADGLALTSSQAEKVLALAETKGDSATVLDRIDHDFGHNPMVADGIARLRELLGVARAADIPERRLRIDLSICRGLDYYTGTIYETDLNDLQIGSVCSGGRYDNLAGLYTKQVLPGVGASLGLDRLLEAMRQLEMLPKTTTPAPVFVVQFAADRLVEYQRLARQLRQAGIGVEVYPEAKKIGPQLQYAERRGFRIALIAGPDEFAKGVVKLKDLTKREERAVAELELLPAVREMLAHQKEGNEK